MVPFKQASCLYSSSALFSAHNNIFWYICFFAIKYDYDAFWKESCLTNTLILCTLVTVKEWSLTVKYELGIACYSGLNQDLLLHVGSSLIIHAENSHSSRFCTASVTQLLGLILSQLTDRKPLLFILWVSIHWDSVIFTNQVGKLNTKLLPHYQWDKGSSVKQF